jgi:hypothetical protein
VGLLLPIGIVAFSLVLPCIFLVWLLRAKVESCAFLFSIVLLVAVDLVVDYLRGSLREPIRALPSTSRRRWGTAPTTW